MPLLGAHMSIAGGYYRAVERGSAVGCNVVQVFTKNNNQWVARPIREDEAELFRTKLAELGISHPLSHSSYLINLASPDRILRERSVDAMAIELERAAMLGISAVVVHPGAFTTSDEATGIRTVAQSLDTVFARTAKLPVDVLLENTAGQGSCLGWRFEHLREIIDACGVPQRLGVCIDTCHAFAAGYDMSTPKRYEYTIAEIDRVIGLARVRAIHLNDSQKPLGSRRDRHAHIGRGMMGTRPFGYLLNDARFAAVPMYLETPKGEEDGRDLDEINLETLRGLVRRRRSKKAAGQSRRQAK
jgi:deoxyribonuclease-4